MAELQLAEQSQLRKAFRGVPTFLAVMTLLVLVAVAVFSPAIARFDPKFIDPFARLMPVGSEHWFGTDGYGRDLFSRVVYGSRISLSIGFIAAAMAICTGLTLGVLAGYFRRLDGLIMSVMDGIMAIPGILLAIALVALSGASLVTVLVAVTIPEVPRVTRLARSIMLSVRSEPYVEVAETLGTRAFTIMYRHMIPNAIPALIVQGTYIFATAMLTEAALSFLGAGIPPEVASWGNIMADGRAYFMLRPGLILFPGVFLSLAVLSINILGDILRDGLDPKMARKI
ncbi:ABC transporter permease [uncultured Castellaniella sp.]|uniref:ABC transporter permease n=1 Tax=uncultured Castellaniella sp. TaxID=647907 RepID=UPI0026311506|nr:ABC transporter permease [uncultured Castellaniella sp.]